MKVRVLVAAALAAGIALGTSGCNLIQPQATLKQYSASDGVNVNLGNIALRNLVVISNDGKTGNLVFGAVNTEVPVALHVEYKSGAKVADGHVVIPFSTQPTLFGTDGHTKVIVEGINTEPGSLLEVAFTVGSKTVTSLIPVLTSEQPEYKGLNPSSVLTVTTH